MNIYIKELLWFCLPISLAFLFTILLFGITVFSENVIDINVHDTYFVLSPYIFIFLLILFTGYVVYLIRLFKPKSANNISNSIFIFYNLMTIVIIACPIIYILQDEDSLPLPSIIIASLFIIGLSYTFFKGIRNFKKLS